LARAGVDVVVLEKHADFLRDFRGDTIHPSTLELMHELGLLEEFLQQPHHKVDRIGAQFGDSLVRLADFTQAADHLQVHRLHAAMGLPQLPRRARPRAIAASI
jgi:2-polyprenyl-6-methoxyphenol hydroxylase-like FAD-dependent oxidoreductase